MDKDNDSNKKMVKWALDHPDEWDVVIGLREANAQKNLEIQQMLKQAGFTELSEMIAIRAYRLLSEEDGR